MPPKRKSKKRPRERQQPQPEELIDDHQREEIISTFKMALKKGNKTLSVHESKKCLKSLEIHTKSDEIQSFLEDLDEEEMDKLSFLKFAATKLIQMEKAHKAFELFDKDKKGVVVLEDLQRVAQELDEDMSEEDLTEMIHFLDRSGDGILCQRDFVRLARKVNL